MSCRNVLRAGIQSTGARAIALAGWWLAPLGAAEAAAFSCAGGFTKGIEMRTFDGASFDVLTLDSKMVTLAAFTLGAWTIVEDTSSPYGFTLQHRRHPLVRLGICSLAGKRVPSDPDRWQQYVASVAAPLGLDPAVLPVADSSQDDTTVELIGWTTREVTLAAPSLPRTEVHLVASAGNLGVAFILSGPNEDVAAAMQDFRFFLSRLERM